MDFCLCYFDFFGDRRGETLFQAVDNAAAIVIAYGLARSARDRRTELWNGDRLMMRRSFPESTSVEENRDQLS